MKVNTERPTFFPERHRKPNNPRYVPKKSYDDIQPMSDDKKLRNRIKVLHNRKLTIEKALSNASPTYTKLYPDKQKAEIKLLEIKESIRKLKELQLKGTLTENDYL